MRSGIGPKKHLEGNGIKVLKDLPGVGSFPKDYPSIGLSYEVLMKDSIHSLWNRPLRGLLEFIKYVTTGKGVLGIPFMQCMLYTNTSLIDNDAFIVKTPADDAKSPLVSNTEIIPIPSRIEHGANSLDRLGVFSLLVMASQPQSHGSIRL